MLVLYCMQRMKFKVQGSVRTLLSDLSILRGHPCLSSGMSGFPHTERTRRVGFPSRADENAADVAGAILPAFSWIRISLVVGVCRGVPGRTEKEIILCPLGDVQSWVTC